MISRSQVVTELTLLLRGDTQANLRADYIECAENTLALLQETVPQGFHYRDQELLTTQD